MKTKHTVAMTLCIVALLFSQLSFANTVISKQNIKSLAKFSVNALESTYKDRNDHISVIVVNHYRSELENCFEEELWENRKILSYGSTEQKTKSAQKINYKCVTEASQKALKDGLLEKLPSDDIQQEKKNYSEVITPEDVLSIAKAFTDEVISEYKHRNDYLSVKIAQKYRAELESCYAKAIKENINIFAYGTEKEAYDVGHEATNECTVKISAQATREGFYKHEK